MAAIFCLFSVALCKLANQTFTQQETISLSAPTHQVINSNNVYNSRICPQHFRYTFSGEENEWQGLVALPSMRLGRTLKIVVKLSIRAELPTVSLKCISSFIKF